MLTDAKEIVGLVSPRYRRWRRLLKGLTLDPDGLTQPVTEPSAGDFLMCGAPRSGTTLLAAVLYQPPRVVTVSEPWDGMRLPPAELFASLRREIDATGVLGRGRLDVATLLREGTVAWCRDGDLPHPVDVTEGYLLGVKWPAFWRYLPHLSATKFLVCIRHPVEVVRSGLKKGGALVEGQDYDIAFNRTMNDALRRATKDAAVRRVLLYDYINSRILPFLGRPNVLTVRYERWLRDPVAMIDEISSFLGGEVGRGHVSIQPPRQQAEFRGDDVDLVRRHCRTAEPLGYRI
jgi:Sulfotransferase family